MYSTVLAFLKLNINDQLLVRIYVYIYIYIKIESLKVMGIRICYETIGLVVRPLIRTIVRT